MNDVKPPKSLKEIQKWFGQAITQAIDENSCISPIGPYGNSIDEEAKQFIRPSLTLAPKERIEIYNQQYWWRLLTIMHENFPLLTALFGYFDFNHSIATPYLENYPPQHWSLNTLGDTLPEWILAKYHQDDKNLVLESALIDLSYNLSFTAGELTLIKAEETVLKQKVALQPHLFLLELSYDLIPFRAEVLKQKPDYFEEHPFPKLNKKQHYLAIYRTPHYQISSKEISYEEYCSLQKFKEGVSVEEFCDWLETQKTSIIREAEKNLIIWFQEWTSLGWIGYAVPCLQERQPT